MGKEPRPLAEQQERAAPQAALALITARTRSTAPTEHECNIDWTAPEKFHADELGAWVQLGAAVAWQIEHMLRASVAEKGQP